MTASALPFRRKLLFAIVLTAAAITILLGSLEAVLRLTNYGYSPHFVRRALAPNGEAIWRENRWATAPYFSPELVRRPLPFRLPEKKSAGTYRIFVLGSSAAMGDPDPSFSFARVLETMLRAAYPDHHFEVINAAVTAINSHIVRGIARDCSKLEPDLFIVYEGNNEVIGPFGPAGVFAPFFRNEAAIHLAIWLKGSRTGQLVSALSRKVRGQRGAPAEWGGMQMFSKQQITADDPRLAAVRDHFRANLRDIAEAGQRAGTVTLFCTVLTNQRDFAPFLSQHRPGLSSEDLVRWQTHIDAAARAARAGDLIAAEASYRAALAIDDRHAELVFKLGRLVLQTGRDTEAQALLQRALDLDTLRFRTDSTLNDVIRGLGAADSHGLEVLDLASILSRRSAHGLVGDDLLYEHVHLTLRGAYAVASEILPRVEADLARRGLVSSAKTTPHPSEYSDTRLRLGFTAHEQAMIALEMLNRFKSPPFSEQADHANRLLRWHQRVEATTTLLARPDALPALREIYQRALAAAPDDWILARNAGSMFVAHKSAAEAVPLLEQAAATIDDDVDTLVALGWAYRALGDAAKSETAFSKARKLEPRYPGLPSEPASPRTPK